METIYIKDGFAYKRTEAEKFTEEVCLGNEYTLVADIDLDPEDTDVRASGIVYKQKYDGTVEPITNNVTLAINNTVNTVTLSPENEVITINITFKNMTKEDIKSMVFTEETTGVCGTVNLGGR